MTHYSRKRTPVVATAVTLGMLSLLVAWGYHSFSASQPEAQVELVRSVVQPAQAMPAADEAEANKPASKPTVAVLPEQNDIDRAEEQPFFEHEVKARLTQVRDQFAEDAQYPSYARPIRNEQELAKYQPNRSFESSTPTDFDDPTAPSVSLLLTRHRYTEGEPIEASATISGLDDSAYSRVEARIVSNRKVLAQASQISESNEQTHRYHILFDRLNALSESGESDFTLIAEFDIEGDRYEVSAPFSYVNSVAQVEGVGNAQAEGEHLQIPVSISVSTAGLHKVTANLYDAETGQALVHLSARAEIPQGGGALVLKAHIASLKRMGREGPYELRDISLMRLPSAPRYLTEYGRSAKESYVVSGFPFTDYEDVPYQDEAVQSRLEFLTQIGGNTEH